MRKINVTKPFLPPLEEYNELLKKIWEVNWLTNRGPLVVSLENKLKNRFKIENITCTTNGTLPLHIGIKAMGIRGEVITTPFSYVATTSSIVWESCTPVFVDIDAYLSIDASKIEKSITDKTSAIIATHVFGNPCDVIEIDRIAKKYNLKVIYDAAHCFDVEYLGKSIFAYGDLSTASFHATKIFHTGEGGCWFTNNSSMQKKLFYHHNFGHFGQENFHGLGTNAKMSELQAAMGLCVLNHIEDIKEKRKKVVNHYIKNLDNGKYEFLKLRPNTKWNYHYFPILFKNEDQLLYFISKLNDQNIFPRRYFYPSLENLPYTNSNNCPISSDVSKRILCLPLYTDLLTSDQNKIIEILNS